MRKEVRFNRIMEKCVACKNAGYPEPQFDYDGGGLWTIFHFGKEYAEVTQKTTQKTTQKLSKMQEDILAYLAINPAASRKELTMHIDNSTEDGIKYNLNRLKKLGRYTT